MNPAAEGLQGGGAILKLLPQSQQQEQEVNTAADHELSHHRTKPEPHIEETRVIKYILYCQVDGQVD